MKANGDGPDGIPAQVVGRAEGGRLAVLPASEVEEDGGGSRVETLDVDLVPAEYRVEGSWLLLTPVGRGAERRFVAAIPLPRFELWVRVPGPFAVVHGRDFVERVVGTLEEALGRAGLSDYVHPWTWPEVEDEEWECSCDAVDIRAAVEVTRKVLNGLSLHPESVIEVRDRDDQPCRTYRLTSRDETTDWADLREVEERAHFTVREAIRRHSACW